MYINFEKLVSYGLNSEQLMALQAVSQKDTAAIFMYEGSLKELGEREFIHYIKSGDVRLTKKGLSVLDTIQESNKAEEAKTLAKQLISYYESENLITGSQKDTERRLNWFLSNTVFSSKAILSTVHRYVHEMDSQGKRKYIPALHNLIWKGKSVFDAKYQLSQSTLYELIVKYYNLNTQVLEKPNAVQRWMFKLVQLGTPPKNVDKDLTFNMESRILEDYLKQIKLKLLK